MPAARHRGFTLIEVLVAVVIMAIMSLMAWQGVDGIVLVRDPDELEGDEKKAQDRFESALIDAAQDTDVEVVGVEMTDTDPSNVAWFSDRGVASVDDLDLVEGKVALVYALLGESGRFGVKDSAERLLPPPPELPGLPKPERKGVSA